jgi:TolB protein
VSRAGAWLAAALGALGCQGPGVSASEIPADPIAIHYRAPEDARRRAEALARQEPDAEPSEGPPALEEIGRQLAALLGAEEGAHEEIEGRLALLDPRSGSVALLDAALPGAVPLDWSPDHRRLLFAQRVGRQVQLMEFDRETRDVRRVTSGQEAQPRGCYGPDGRIVFLAVDARRRTMVVKITAGGGAEPERVSAFEVAHSPACAPDGSAIAYVAVLPSGAERLVTHVPAPDGPPRMIGPGRDPRFSPDGEWIVYSGPVGAGRRLFRIRPDGTGRSPIGRGNQDELRPAVSPDGRLVAYVIEVGSRPWLYLRRVDGSGDRILFSDGDADNPVW